MNRLVLAPVLALALLLSGCCKPNTPPSFWCTVGERTVDCLKEIAPTTVAALGARVLSALRGGGDWSALLQELVNTFGDQAICVIGNLPAIFSKAPAAGPEELARRAADLAKARQFLESRRLKTTQLGGAK